MWKRCVSMAAILCFSSLTYAESKVSAPPPAKPAPATAFVDVPRAAALGLTCQGSGQTHAWHWALEVSEKAARVSLDGYLVDRWQALVTHPLTRAENDKDLFLLQTQRAKHSTVTILFRREDCWLETDAVFPIAVTYVEGTQALVGCCLPAGADRETLPRRDPR